MGGGLILFVLCGGCIIRWCSPILLSGEGLALDGNGEFVVTDSMG